VDPTAGSKVLAVLALASVADAVAVALYFSDEWIFLIIIFSYFTIS
jgi:hypothetical protein